MFSMSIYTVPCIQGLGVGQGLSHRELNSLMFSQWNPLLLSSSRRQSHALHQGTEIGFSITYRPPWALLLVYKLTYSSTHSESCHQNLLLASSPTLRNTVHIAGPTYTSPICRPKVSPSCLQSHCLFLHSIILDKEMYKWGDLRWS